MWFLLLLKIVLLESCQGFCWTSNCKTADSSPTKSPVIEKITTVSPEQLSDVPSITPSLKATILEIETDAPSSVVPNNTGSPELVSSVSPSGQIIVTEAEGAGQQEVEHVVFKPKYTTGPYKFALIPKSTTNLFFISAFAGCKERSDKLPGEVECILLGPKEDDPQVQSDLIYELVDTEAVQGIAVSVSSAQVINEAINYAIAAGVPVITFDSDAPQSQRLSYIGTNNFAFGEQLAKVLLQLDPTGYQNGRFGFVSAGGPNLAERLDGFRSKLQSYDAAKMPWQEVPYSPTNCEDQNDVALQQMYQYADDPQIRAIIPVGGWPMWEEAGWKEFVNSYSNRTNQLTLVVADSLQSQIEALNKGLVNGLVGQLPYQMGEFSIQALWDINEGNGVSQIISGTNLLQVLRVPLTLPSIDIDRNFLGNVAYLGYFFFAIIAIFSIGFAIMSFKYRDARVVRASQPFFLFLICIGILILGSTIIPASIDNERHSMKACNIACMCTPWLLCIGFTTTFSALFSKTWRINQVMRNAAKFKRVKVEVKDVMLPFIIIMVINLIILISWTAISPLKYHRFPDPGTDPWNRVIKTYGICSSEHSVIFGSILFSIAIILLVISNVQAYQARRITTEFSESKYIAIAVAVVLQAFIIGAPVLMLSREQPTTSYIVLCLLIFVTCTTVLFLIMGPKAKVITMPPPPPKPAKNRWSNQSSKTNNSPSNGDAGLKINAIKSLQIKFQGMSSAQS